MAVIDVGPHGIQRIDLLCTGFHPEETSTYAS